MLVIKQVSLKKILQTKLKAKKEKNKNYSLRAFARDLDVSPAALSRYLNFEKGLSIAKVNALLTVLEVTPLEREFILSDYCIKKYKNEDKVSHAKERLLGLKSEYYTHIPDEDYASINQWFYFAILALIQTRDFSSDPVWISKRIGIEPSLAAFALNKLSLLGMICKDSLGNYSVNGSYFTKSDHRSKKAIREFHQQMILKAHESVERCDLTDRDLSSFLLSVKKSEMNEARKMIKEFREMFSLRFSNNKEVEQHDEVFGFNIQFFQLSHSLLNTESSQVGETDVA